VIKSVVIPGDKSISHRALLISALRKGITKIHGFLESDDCIATARALRMMGVTIENKNDVWLVHGVGLHGLKAPKNSIDCGNSGTTMRLLAGILVAQSFDSVLIGDESLSKRPMMRIVEPLRKMGARIEATDGHAPLNITGGNVLHGISYTPPMASAQVKSCILLAGLYAKGKTEVVEPIKTRNHTELMLEHKGNIQVPGDLSSAAFFIVFACIRQGEAIRLPAIGLNPTRTGVLDILRAMGAKIAIENQRCFGSEPVGDMIIHASKLKAVDIDEAMLVRAIDEFPILMIAAACTDGVTCFRGIEELRHKESDRVQAMQEGLTNLGIRVDVDVHEVRVRGGEFQSGVVDARGDHRIAMAFYILEKLIASNIGVINGDMVKTSFPNFHEITYHSSIF